MNRRRNPATTPYELRAREGIDWHDGRTAEQSAELNHLTHLAAWHWNDAHRGRLVVHHADGHFIGDDRGNRFSRSRTRHRHHVDAHRTDAGPRFKLIQAERPRARSSDHAGVLRDWDEGAAHA